MDSDVLVLEPDRNGFEWTPGVIRSEVAIRGNLADVTLTSQTPNLKEYQMKVLPGGRWMPAGDHIKLPLRKKKYEWAFRTVNLAGVAGPENKVVIERE